MIFLISVPLGLGHDVITVDDDAPVEEIAPILVQFNLSKAHRQLIPVSHEDFSIVCDGLTEVDIRSILLIEDNGHGGISPISIVDQKDEQDVLFGLGILGDLLAILWLLFILLFLIVTILHVSLLVIGCRTETLNHILIVIIDRCSLRLTIIRNIVIFEHVNGWVCLHFATGQGILLVLRLGSAEILSRLLVVVVLLGSCGSVLVISSGCIIIIFKSASMNLINF